MKHYILILINLILVFLCFICCYENKKYSNKNFEVTAEVIKDMQEKIKDQDHKIEMYEQYCDNIAKCIVEEKW